MKTFARCPLVDDPEDVDVAVLGIPFDTATTNRPGARFGPEAIRSASIALRPYNAAQDAQVFGRLSVADLGDVAVTPGNAERTVGADRRAPRADRAHRARGRSASAATTSSCSASCGRTPPSTARSASCSSTPTPTSGTCTAASATTTARRFGARSRRGSSTRALAPRRDARARSTARRTWTCRRSSASRCISGDELVTLSHEEYGARVRARVGDGPLFLSFDIDVLDPAYAPGTGTPEVGGLTTREALGYLRALRGLRFSGYDVVEVSPPYDVAGSADRRRGGERRVRAPDARRPSGRPR